MKEMIMPRILQAIIALAILTITNFISINSYAQRRFADEPTTVDRFAFGLGLGFDYGGFGANVIGYPQKNIGIFLGVGYALIGAGYNCGLKFRFLAHDKPPRTVPYLTGMYGYNAAVGVSGASQYNKFFYGPSFGAGLDLYPKHKKSGYWSLAVMVPVRSPDVNNYIDYLKTQGASFNNSLIPISFSAGFHFAK
jgi:hypothetical protein